MSDAKTHVDPTKNCPRCHATDFETTTAPESLGNRYKCQKCGLNWRTRDGKLDLGDDPQAPFFEQITLIKPRDPLPPGIIFERRYNDGAMEYWGNLHIEGKITHLGHTVPVQADIPFKIDLPKIKPAPFSWQFGAGDHDEAYGHINACRCEAFAGYEASMIKADAEAKAKIETDTKAAIERAVKAKQSEILIANAAGGVRGVAKPA